MTDLEKLINALCELPSFDLEGDEVINVRYATLRYNEPFVLLEGDEGIYLHPTQALVLLSWLTEQRPNLESLRDALQAKQIEEEATKAQREVERLNALKIKHSEAVIAWQEGGCVGPCPSFEEIANPKVDFIRKFPLLERMLKERQG